MRNFAIGILIIFSCRETLAQDTIHFRDGAIKVAKIVEVGISNVKYYHYDNLNGPIHVSAKDEISFIKYTNGSKDSFPKTSTNSNANTNSQGFVKIEIRDEIFSHKYYYNSRYLTTSRFYDLVDDYPKPDKKIKLQNEILIMRMYDKKRDYFFTRGLCCGGLAYVTALVYVYTSFNSQNTAALVAGGALAIAGLSMVMISGTYTIRYRDQKLKTVKMYNFLD